jgi:hypothetical protein
VHDAEGRVVHLHDGAHDHAHAGKDHRHG